MNNTIVEGLKPYALGEKLRNLRLKKSMGLVELGRHSGLSPAMLSKLERGKLFPTLPTLLRIAMVFGVGLDFFFTDERKRHVVSIVRK
jgi:transcriptional regulator with XRE-family HTH domain